MKKLKSKCINIDEYMFYDIYKMIFDNTFNLELSESDIKKLVQKIDEKCWKYFLDMSRLKEIATRKQIEKIIEDIEKRTIPFTLESATTYLGDMKSKYVDTIENLVKDVYQHFTGIKYFGNSWKEGRKINNAQRIEKVFRCSEPIYWETYFSCFKRSYYRSPMFNELEKLCFLLDSKKIPRYPDMIEDQLEKKNKKGKIENEYFEVVLYMNGNQKVKFLRLDILDKINQIGGGMNRNEIGGVLKKYKEKI